MRGLIFFVLSKGLLSFQSNLGSELLKVIKVIFQIEFILHDLDEERVELRSQFTSLYLIFAIYELLDLNAKAVE